MHQLRHNGAHPLLDDLQSEPPAAAAKAAPRRRRRGVPGARGVRPGQQHLCQYACRDALRVHRQPRGRQVGEAGGQGQGARHRAGQLRLCRCRATACCCRHCYRRGRWRGVCHSHLQSLQDELSPTASTRLRRQAHCQLVPGCHQLQEAGAALILQPRQRSRQRC